MKIEIIDIKNDSGSVEFLRFYTDSDRFGYPVGDGNYPCRQHGFNYESFHNMNHILQEINYQNVERVTYITRPTEAKFIVITKQFNFVKVNFNTLTNVISIETYFENLVYSLDENSLRDIVSVINMLIKENRQNEYVKG